jgi:dihydroflavonol-4-reductase
LGESVFVTGGSGFIGSNLIKRLLEEGYEVAALWRPGSSHPIINGLGFRMCPGDLSDRAVLVKGMAGADYVFHSAAKISFNRSEYDELYRVNVEGTRNVLEAARMAGIKKLVHISACAVFGYSHDKDGTIDEGSRPVIPKQSVYAYTKMLAEDEVADATAKGLVACTVNPATVYGQGDRSLNSGFLIKAVYTGGLKLAPPGGTSVVSVDDVVDGAILALKNGRTGERYILSNENLRYIDLCNVIADALKARRIKYSVPSFLYLPAVSSIQLVETALKLLGRPHPLLTVQVAKETFAYKYFNSAKAREELGWRPRTGVSDAVLKAFDFYRKEGIII